jgi:serine/threonine protein kinase
VRAGDIIDGRFEVEILAGFGGTSAVYRARDLTSSQKIAIKFLNAETWPMVQRFVREARILSDLQHPGIVRYIAHGIADGGVPYLAMEWLEGESLAHALGRRDRMRVRPALEVMRGATDALAVAHSRGIVHRDLKPSNLFLVDRNVSTVKLLDFGLARGSKNLQPVTTTGNVVGTPGYMAPEQARGVEEIGATADIFSLGCVLYECLTGQPAFAGQHLTAILSKVLVEQAPSMRKKRPEIAPALDDLVSRMLSKRPEQRPANAQELKAELDRLLENGAAEKYTGDQPPPILASAAVHCVVMVGDSRTGSAGPPSAPAGGEIRRLQSIVSRYAGEFEFLGDGSILLMFRGSEAPQELASQAAECALELRALLPKAPMALAMSPVSPAKPVALGVVIDRAAALLESLPPVPFGPQAKLNPNSSARIRVDPTAATLLSADYEIAQGRPGDAHLIGPKLGS